MTKCAPWPPTGPTRSSWSSVAWTRSTSSPARGRGRSSRRRSPARSPTSRVRAFRAWCGSGRTRTSTAGSIDAWSHAVNDEIQYQLAVRGAGVFADWTTVAAGHPEYFVRTESHLTDAGKQAYITMIQRQPCATASPTRKGSLDVVTGGIGARVQGWSYDPDTNAPDSGTRLRRRHVQGRVDREHLAA